MAVANRYLKTVTGVSSSPPGSARISRHTPTQPDKALIHPFGLCAASNLLINGGSAVAVAAGRKPCRRSQEHGGASSVVEQRTQQTAEAEAVKEQCHCRNPLVRAPKTRDQRFEPSRRRQMDFLENPSSLRVSPKLSFHASPPWYRHRL